jgi:hypothetical protein
MKKKNNLKVLQVFILAVIANCNGLSQPIPSNDEKFTFLTTFSKDANKKYGDDDNVQTVFFSIPETNKGEVYIRIFDPEVGGQNDEVVKDFNSKTKYSVYGGKGAHSNKDAIAVDPKGNFKSGVLLVSKTFDNDPKYDNGWYTFGPFNPSQGELQPENGGYVFKFIIEGLDGDDGNLYKLFLSGSADNNVAIEGGNSFCYEYSLRLSDKVGSVSHIYPFLPLNLSAVKIHIFDYDDEGSVRLVTICKKGQVKGSSTEATWSVEEVKIVPQELNTTMDIQFIKKKAVKNNNIVVYITNQYNETVAFYSAPIGGVPKYKYRIEANKIDN